jgi:hypothetical protein
VIERLLVSRVGLFGSRTEHGFRAHPGVELFWRQEAAGGTKYSQPHYTIDARDTSIEENISYREGWLNARETDRDSK